MPGLTSAQLCTLACQIAKAPGYVSQAGQCLNMILADLCQTYDFEVARRTHYFNFDPGATALVGNAVTGSGPYDLPEDFLRLENAEAATYNIGDGVPRRLIGCDLTQFDQLVQQAGNQSYPAILAVDMSPLDATEQGDASPSPQAYVWPPPSGAFAVQLRYFCQMPDIATPETSSSVPWFPNQEYLKTRLAGEVMQLSDDERAPSFTGSNAMGTGAQDILGRYLKLKDNSSNRAKSVRLDPRTFGGGGGFSSLPNTKILGW